MEFRRAMEGVARLEPGELGEPPSDPSCEALPSGESPSDPLRENDLRRSNGLAFGLDDAFSAVTDGRRPPLKESRRSPRDDSGASLEARRRHASGHSLRLRGARKTCVSASEIVRSHISTIPPLAVAHGPGRCGESSAMLFSTPLRRVAWDAATYGLARCMRAVRAARAARAGRQGEAVAQRGTPEGSRPADTPRAPQLAEH